MPVLVQIWTEAEGYVRASNGPNKVVRQFKGIYENFVALKFRPDKISSVSFHCDILERAIFSHSISWFRSATAGYVIECGVWRR